MKINLLKIVKSRTILLDKIDNNIEARNKRIETLKRNNLFIHEAAPAYKESYTK